MKFAYDIELKRGYRRVLELEEIDTVRVIIEAECRVNADKALRALLQDAPNVVNHSGFCIEG